MKEKNWCLLGFLFTSVFGSLFHFLYDWFPSGFTAVIGAVNESTWEHMKLAFWPMLLFAVAEFLEYGKRSKSFVPIRVLSILIAVLLIPILFYSYTGAFGKSVTALDILIFYVSVCAAYGFSCRQLRHPQAYFGTTWANVVAILILLALLICFLSFTIQPPHIPLFRDPVSGGYGIV